MDDGIATSIKLLGVVVLVALNGFFVASEFALVRARRTRLTRMAQEKRFGTALGLHLLQNINAYLSASQLGVTMTSLGLGWLAESALANFFEPLLSDLGMGPATGGVSHGLSASLVFLFITFLHIVAGEQAPKVLAIQKAEETIQWIAWPLRVFHTVIFPAIWVLNSASLGLLRWLGLQPAHERETPHTAEELRLLLQQSSRTNQLTPVGGSLLLNALELRRRKARQVMLHRTKIAFLSTHRGIEENLQVARRSGHSRFPLCEGTIDQVIGMIHLKDLMWLVKDEKENANLQSIRREVLFVPENMPLEKLLNIFLTRRIHMAILVDEFGTIVGMVTLENILEEIVGDIQEEFDQEALMVQKISDTEYRLHGELPLHDVESLLGIQLAAEDVTTMGGYVMEKLGRLPETGETIQSSGYEFTVLRTSGQQISQVSARCLQPHEELVDFSV